jgi:hypothetical protein
VPKLYEYFGLIVMFYANEHDPVHVHGKSQGRESRAEIIVINGKVSEVRYTSVLGRSPLDNNEMRFFEEIVSARADEIVSKWIDFFVLHKSIKPERITRRLK